MKHKIKDTELRSWQIDACEIVDFNTNNVVMGNVIPINACVGSGKTLVSGYAFGGFIAENFKNKTVQMFITPRIRLCGQQAEEIINIVEKMHDFKHHVDFDVIRRDCENMDFNFKSTDLASRHTIIVVCDKSFWGDFDDSDDVKKSSIRWNYWKKCFDKWTEDSVKLGNIVFDEAHNFDKPRIHKLLFGEYIVDENTGHEDAVDESLDI